MPGFSDFYFICVNPKCNQKGTKKSESLRETFKGMQCLKLLTKPRKKLLTLLQNKLNTVHVHYINTSLNLMDKPLVLPKNHLKS